MDFIRVRAKFEEPFKDGNVLEGRSFNTGQIVEMSEADFNKVLQSGGTITALEKLVPNPKKHDEPVENLDNKSGKKNAKN
jgi:hypothetical protein